VAQPVVDFCSRRLGWHFISIGQRVCIFGIVLYVVLTAQLIAEHITDYFANALYLLSAIVNTAFHGFATWLGVTRARRTKPGFINPNVQVLFGMRFSGWFCTTLSVVPPLVGALEQVRITVPFVIMLAGYYILSCQEGPPKQQRQRAPTGRLTAEAA
jgi:bacteriorhodopsin